LSYEDSELLKQEFVPTVGQMMGSYLCFPLLCLQNYLAFSWACKTGGLENAPCLINGDDILFQAESDEFFAHWHKTILEVGFEVERSKTSVSRDYGSINSTLVRFGGGELRPVRTYRFGMLRPVNHPSGLGAAFDSFAKVGKPSRWYRAGIEFLHWHKRSIIRWFCSPQEAGFYGRLARSCWKGFGRGVLWEREVLRTKLEDFPSLRPLSCPHTIIMASKEFQVFPEGTIGKREEGEISRWMAARKWELGKTFQRVKAEKELADRQSKILKVCSPKLFSSLKSVREFLTIEVRDAFRGLFYEPPVRTLYGPPKEFCTGAYVGTATFGGRVVSRLTSVWKKPAKKTTIRIPVPLLAEFGLSVESEPVEEILGREDHDFGFGSRLFFEMDSNLGGILKTFETALPRPHVFGSSLPSSFTFSC